MKFNKESLKQVAHVVADVELDSHIIGKVALEMIGHCNTNTTNNN